MFISKSLKQKIQFDLMYLEAEVKRLKMKVDTLEASTSALLKIATNKAKLDAEQSSVTVTVHAPHGLRKDGTPKKKPGRKREELL